MWGKGVCAGRRQETEEGRNSDGKSNHDDNGCTGKARISLRSSVDGVSSLVLLYDQRLVVDRKIGSKKND